MEKTPVGHGSRYVVEYCFSYIFILHFQLKILAWETPPLGMEVNNNMHNNILFNIIFSIYFFTTFSTRNTNLGQPPVRHGDRYMVEHYHI